LRDTFVQMKVQADNLHKSFLRLPRVVPAVAARLEGQSLWVESEIRAIERELVAFTKQDDPWAIAARRVMTIRGIGLLTARRIIVTTRCFENCDTPDQAASYAGLVPFARTSGTSLRERQAGKHGGNRLLRLALYQAAGSAIRFNTGLRVFYDRLRAAGKPAKLARCAVARKLLHIAWAVVTKKRDYDPEYQSRKRAPAT
jgi:transposase